MARSVNFLPVVGDPASVEGSAPVRQRRFRQALRQAGACPLCFRTSSMSHGLCGMCFDPVNDEADGKWSSRRTLAFIILTCGGFWAVVIGLIVGALSR